MGQRQCGVLRANVERVPVSDVGPELFPVLLCFVEADSKMTEQQEAPGTSQAAQEQVGLQGPWLTR